jgi:hypothetical protein
MDVFDLQRPSISESVEFQWNFTEISGTAPLKFGFHCRPTTAESRLRTLGFIGFFGV